MLTIKIMDKTWFFLSALALLVPRELNFRPWRLSFSITDVVFVLMVLIFIALLIKKDIDLKKHSKINFVLLSSILLIICIGIIDWQFKGIGNKYVFFKDLYTFLIVPIVFIITFYIAKPNLFNYVLLIFISNTLLAIFSIMIIKIPPLTKWYIGVTEGFLITLADRMGYIITIKNTFTNVGTLKTNFLVGGVGNPGMVALLGLPLYFAYFKHIKLKCSILLTSVSIILIILASLYLFSITVLVGLIMSVVTWFIFSRENKKEKVTCLILIFTAILIFIADGQGGYLLKRLSKVKHYLLFKSSVEDNVQKLPPTSTAPTSTAPTSTETRAQAYSEAVRRIRENPLLGIGMGNHFEFSVIKGKYIENYRTDRVENFYLTLFLKLGIAGFTFLFLFFFLFYKTYSYLKLHSPESYGYAFVTGIFSALSAFLLVGLFEYIFYSLSLNILLCTSIALCAKIIANQNA